MKLLRLLAAVLCLASPALAQVNPGTSPLSIAKGGTSAATAAAARTALGLLIGTNVQAWDADLDAVAALACTGAIVRTASNTVTCRTITGTAAEITVTNGDGVAGVPTLSLPTALTFTGKTITGGTFASVTMTAPALGTPASGVATNLTGTAAGLTAGTASAVAVGGITGLGTGVGTFLATPSSANLRTALTDESGAGVAYFQGGDIGTPSAGNATNIIGLNASQLNAGTIPTARYATVSAFSVNKNAVDQTGVVSGASTTITWGNEVYDVNNHFTANGWTPDAGKVTINAAFLASGTITAGATCAIIINKNGSLFKQSFWASLTNAATAFIAVDDIANGTDVYTIQANVTTSAGTATINGTTAYTFFTGHWISP